MVKGLTLINGMVALVDDEDYEKCMKYKWNAYEATRDNYNELQVKNSKNVSLARFILSLNITEQRRVLRLDGNPLNFQKENLVLTNVSEIPRKSNSYRNSSSKYKGVNWDKKTKSWRAEIRLEGKNKFLGRYQNEVEAAKAYNRAVLYFLDGNSYLNVINEDDEPL